MNCPACHQQAPDGAVECPSCGIVFLKWGGNRPHRPRTVEKPLAKPPSHAVPSKPGIARRLATIVVLSLIGAGVIVGGYWFVEIRPRIRRIEGRDALPSRGKTIAINRAAGEFDRSIRLPGSPQGMAWNGTDLLIGNREDPWGFLRLRFVGREEVTVQKVPVIEQSNLQNVAFRTVTWNGSNWLAVTDGAWFGATSDSVFVELDRDTLSVTGRVRPAPPKIGCLAWDGNFYWAATRRNTEAEGADALLYRLDQGLQVVETFAPPAVGCQGLAWDGSRLWFADVFTDRVYAIDISQKPPTWPEPQLIRPHYLSGLAWDGRNIWLSEYGENTLLRFSPEARLAMSGGASLPLEASALSVKVSAGGEDIATLRQQLRDPNWSVRLRAQFALERMGQPIDYDRDDNDFPKAPTPETAQVLTASAELNGSSLYSSWRMFFGDALFSKQPENVAGMITIPTFARYEVTVEGGTLEAPSKVTFDATPGEHSKENVLLAKGLGPGKYTVSFFIHIQYVAPDGGSRILNYSEATLHVSR